MTQHASAAPEGPTAATSERPQTSGGPTIQRQFVNFAFYKLDPAFRRLDERAGIIGVPPSIAMRRPRSAIRSRP